MLLPQVGRAHVHAALSLVGCQSDLRKAMQYVFGSALVCDTLDDAKKVAFDKRVMTKTVTLGGDVFDPQGTLSGGERRRRRPSASGLLVPRGAVAVSVLLPVWCRRRSLPVGVGSGQPAGAEGGSGGAAGQRGAASGGGPPAGWAEGDGRQVRRRSALAGPVQPRAPRGWMDNECARSRYRRLKQQCELKVEEQQILEAKLQQSSFHQQQEELERLRRTIGEGKRGRAAAHRRRFH